MWETTKCREDAIRREAATGCKERKWAAMVHLMALSSVIGRPIYSAFPNDNSKTRPLFHGEISPRETPIQTDRPFILQEKEAVTLVQKVGINLIISFLSWKDWPSPLQKSVQ